MSREFTWGKEFQAERLASAKALHCDIEAGSREANVSGN